MLNKKKYLGIICLAFGIIHFSCSDMIEKGIESTQDMRIPDINVKQGSTEIPVNSEYNLKFENGIAVETSSDPVIFTIENTGSADLLISEIVIDGADEDEFQTDGGLDGTYLPAGTNSTFSIVFSPETADLKNATVTILTDDFDEGEYSFSLSARSKPVADFSARLKTGYPPLAVQFENRSLGDIEEYQ